MKKYLFIIIGCVIVGGISYLITNGNPITKQITKMEVSEYLRERYLQEMVIEKVYYSFKENIYLVSAYPKGREELGFTIRKHKSDNKVHFSDSLIERIWQYEVNSELNSYVQKETSKNCSGTIIMASDPIFNSNDKNINIDEIPNYNEVRSKFKGSIPIYIDLVEYNEEKEIVNSLFNILMFIKHKAYEPDYITIFTKNKQYNIRNNRLHEINEINDLNSILNEID